jgi:outer membrane protein assembly factor BamB
MQLVALLGLIVILASVGAYAMLGREKGLPITGNVPTGLPGEDVFIPNAVTPTQSSFLPFIVKGGATPTKTPTQAATNTPGPIPTGGDEWNQLGGNAGHTGYISATIQTPWKVRWIWNGPAGGGEGGPTGDHLALPKDIQPVVGGGMLYIGHSDGYLRAISQATGVQTWATNLENPIMNTAAYDPGSNSVYAGTTDGRFWRLDASSGQVMRSNRPGGQVLMAPLLVGDNVYIGSNDGTFYAFDKLTLSQVWSYDAGAALIASPAYTPNHNGLILFEAEDKSVHAIHVSDGTRAWRVVVNADVDPKRNTVFADTYPVVSNVNDVVIVRSYLAWPKIWKPDGGAPSTVDEIRTYLTQNPTYQSFFVLNLLDGSQKYVAPVMLGAIGNGGDLASTPPQAVVKRLPDGSEVAYLLWRTRQACIQSFCDGREDTTLGEMDLGTGNIRFVREYKNQGDMRLPTDEQSPLSMAGNTLLYSHWMLLGILQIGDRSAGLGGSYANPIHSTELPPVLNTLSAGTCSSRSGHYCPAYMNPPCDTYGVDPGFYTYYSSTCAYNSNFSTPVRNAVISDKTVYWKSVDGAIIALESKN